MCARIIGDATKVVRPQANCAAPELTLQCGPFWKTEASIWVKVADNGEGNNAAPDKITLVFVVASSVTCETDINAPLVNVEKGNVQVRP
jgi:hypothetical protein